jgi:hypothetical protein
MSAILKKKMLFFVIILAITLVLFVMAMLIVLGRVVLLQYEPINLPYVSIIQIDGKDKLLVRCVEHPPWAHSHIYSYEFNETEKKIIISESYIPFQFFSKPNLTSNCFLFGLDCDQYQIYWFDTCLGHVTITNNKITWHENTLIQ